jgi:hypothetical protein
MALPAVPVGYTSWNAYIEAEAPALALAEGITLQQAKASIKLLEVAKPIRSAVGEPYFRQYNVFTTWADRAVLPAAGRPWILGPVLANLQLYYDPSNTSSYPGTGTTINNLAPTSLPGTMSNITFTSPYFSYNGTSSQISIADNSALEPGAGDWTMEAWFRVTAFGSSQVVLGKFDNGGLAQDVSYSIRLNTTGNLFAQLGSGSGAGATLFVDSTAYQTVLDTWYQVVYVFTNVATNSLETYINGSSIGSVTHSLSSILNSTNPLYLGSYNGGEYSQWFNGSTGVVRLYNAALTADQVLQNYNADRSKYGL